MHAPASISSDCTCPPPPGLPLVVQLGFAGSRRLLDRAAHPGVDPAQFEAALQPLLTARLRRVPAELGLHPDRHPVCGLSSLAIGADTLFSRACRELPWPHRVLLPQHREDFLHARGSDGTPDFSETEAAAARDLLASPQVIQERVIGESPDRHERFEDVNLELVRVCDVLVVLLRLGVDGKPGGALEALGQALASRRTVLELRPDGECCDRDLPPDSNEVCPCTFESTDCPGCVTHLLGLVCPICDEVP